MTGEPLRGRERQTKGSYRLSTAPDNENVSDQSIEASTLFIGKRLIQKSLAGKWKFKQELFVQMVHQPSVKAQLKPVNATAPVSD